jgi:uncharacterized membrane protein YfcA
MQIYLPIAEVSVNGLGLLLIGTMVGLLSGLFGVGGGFILTPLLFFIGIPPAVAVASAANQIAGSSFSAFLAHWQRRTVDVRMGLVLLAGGLIGSAAGVQAFTLLREAGQFELVVSLLYVVMLGTVGGLMLMESLPAARGVLPAARGVLPAGLGRAVVPGARVLFVGAHRCRSGLNVAPPDGTVTVDRKRGRG